ncbi:MAG: hypothetical protein ACFHX7_17495 [Pseudomonadota bacterium]
MRLIVTVLLGLSGSCCALAATLPPLPDQFGFSRGLSPDASPALVIVVDARRLRRIRKWELALAERYPELDILRVADVPRDPPAEQGAVAEQLRKRVPADVPVTIDMAGLWSTRFALDVSEPCLLVFSRGELQAKQSGPFTTDGLEGLLAALDALTEGSPVREIE